MRIVLISFLLAVSSLFLTAAEFSVPYLEKPPVIDGRFDAGEWSCAMAFSGTRTMDPRRITVWMGYDKETLYVAMQAETPPRGKLATGASTISDDDSLELWFAPPQALRTVESLKFGTFQIIVNSEDKLLAVHNNPGYGLGSHD